MAEIRVFVVVMIIIAATTITITTVLIMAALRNRAGYYIYAPWFLLLLSFFFHRLISAVGDWMSTILLHMVWPYANVECTSETCYTQLAGNAGPKKPPENRHLGTIAQLCLAISSQLRHVSTIGKKTAISPHTSLQYRELRPTSG